MGNMRNLFAISALAAAAARVQAQDLNQTIVGCAALECPPSSEDTASDNCTVADTGSFTYVGLTRVPTQNQALAGLSWTMGFNVTLDGNRSFHNSFYLGTPPNLHLDGKTGACAVFLHGASASLKFPNAIADEVAQGTCADAMGTSCVNELVSHAKTLVDGYLKEDQKPSIADTCSRLQRDLQDDNKGACAQFTRGGWTNFTSAALTGEGAPTAITQQQNASSNCWPIIPKQDSLTLVSQYRVEGSADLSDLGKALYAITPVLTVFYSAESGSLVTNTDASLSCLKVVGPPRASLDTISSGSGDHGSGAAGLSSSRTWLSVAFSVAVAALFAHI